MNEPDATFTNGLYELPPHARGVLVLADPPEAGWRIQTDSDAPAARAGLSGQDDILDVADTVVIRPDPERQAAS